MSYLAREHPLRPHRAALLAALACLVLSAGALAQTHPRLLFDSADLTDMQSRMSDPYYADPWNEILIECRFVWGPGQSINTSSPQRMYRQAICAHGLLLLIDPTTAADSLYDSDDRFFDYFWAVFNYSGWSDLFGDSDITTGYLLTGLALGYDIGYPNFTAAERTQIVTKLGNIADQMLTGDMVAVPTDLNDPTEGYKRTYKVLRNKFIIPVSALGMVAYCLEGEVDETRRQTWLTRLDECLTAFTNHARPDGVSPESYAYHEYMMQPFLMMLEARSRATSTNLFESIPYVKNHAYYSTYAWIPGGNHSFTVGVPFGDGDPAPPASMRLTAAHLAGRIAGHTARMDEVCNWAQWSEVNGPLVNSYERDDCLRYVVGNDAVAITSPTALGLPTWRYFPDSGLFVWRSGWDDIATYFALFCGPQLGGHMQPEMGNFIVYKGGSPYIAHHGYTDTRRTEHHNVLRIAGAGQYGDGGYQHTEPEPPEHWPNIEEVVATEDGFYVRADLTPIYSDSSLISYVREYVGFQDHYFVRDNIERSGSATAESYLHAYMTDPPVANIYIENQYAPLDIDSNRSGNPWAGSGTQYTVTPRTSGPYTGAMHVVDLSAAAWSSAVSQSIVSIHNSGDTQRGYKMVRTQSGAAVTGLMGFAFASSGRSLSKWPASDGEGFLATSASGDVVRCAWPASGGAISGTQGLELSGTMGGVGDGRGIYWGRNVTSLKLRGQKALSATEPVSIMAHTGGAATGRFAIRCDSAADIVLYHPDPVSAVSVDGVALGSGWSWNERFLTLTGFGPYSDAAQVRTTIDSSALKPGFTPQQALRIESDGQFFAAAWDYDSSQWVGSVDSLQEGYLTYSATADSWIGAFLYDYAQAGYVEGAYALWRDAD